VVPLDRVDGCRRLLYEVYYEEGGWDPPQPNASGLRANHERRRLEDQIDHEATWIGVIDRDGRLVATTRIIDRQSSGALEIERYIALPPDLEGAAVIEANRVAVRRSHRKTWALAIAQMMAISTARRHGARRSVGAASAKIAFGPAAAYGWRSTGISFRYHEDDPEPVHLIHCDLDELLRLRTLSRAPLRMLKLLLRR